MEEKLFYKVSEVAKIFNVSRRTAYRWLEEKQMKAVKIGKTLRVPKSEIEKYMQEVKNG